MIKRITNSKEAAIKASRTLKKGKICSSDYLDTKTELEKFVRKIRKRSNLKGKYPLICFKCCTIGYYVAKCPHKHDIYDED